MSFSCSHMTHYPKNHCFSNRSLVITLKEFDDIYNKEIVKRYEKHEIQSFIMQNEKKIEKESMVL